jgi:NHLM bacteriocin system ABC transporter peptidase/ATP-binding protein
MSQYPPREETPTILQMDNAECGAIALAIILGYFGRYVSSSEVREACGVTRDGSKALNMIKASRRYGLETHGMQLSLDQVQLLPPPFIVYWQFNHFLVVEGFSEDQVYLNDPATGPRRVTREAFSQGFTGVVLFMNPGPDFQTGGEAEPGILTLLWRHLRNTRSHFLSIVGLVTLSAIPVIGLAFFAKIFFDQIWTAHQRDWLPGLLLGMLLSAVLMSVLIGCQRYYLLKLYLKLKLTHTMQFFWRLLQLPLNFFQQRAVGDLAERVESHNRLVHILTDKTLVHIEGFLRLTLFAVMMLLLSIPLGLISLAIAAIAFVLLRLVLRHNEDIGKRFAQTEGNLSAIEMNGIQMIETLKADSAENQFFNHWAAVHAQKTMSEQAMVNHENTVKILSFLLQGLNLVVLFAGGGFLILHQQLTPGGLFALQILLLGFYEALFAHVGIGQYLGKLKGEVARILDIEQQAPEQILATETTDLSLFSTTEPVLDCRQIRFGYSLLEPPIFEDISLRIGVGERVAIVGPSGGGKSSLAKLICGLYAPWSGDIIMHGAPLAKISRAWLSNFMGLVDQQIFLFAATLRENLTLWNPEISDAAIYRALDVVEMSSLIRDRGGLDCRVEEGGKNFSGGQIQRLEIARVLIADPKLLILDEATAALDPLIEQKIYANLQKHHCTLLIIAHRLSAIRDCDQIIVIDGGKIVQQGRHETLIKDNGLYKDLVSLEIL